MPFRIRLFCKDQDQNQGCECFDEDNRYHGPYKSRKEADFKGWDIIRAGAAGWDYTIEKIKTEKKTKHLK